MCLAVPGKIIALVGNDPLSRSAKIAFSGVVKQASLSLLPEARTGDYVLVHAGFAITRLNEDEAHRTMQYLREMSGDELEEELGAMSGADTGAGTEAGTDPTTDPKTKAEFGA